MGDAAQAAASEAIERSFGSHSEATGKQAERGAHRTLLCSL